MANQIEGFGGIAGGLSRNPLGIIALFIVLVYGFACLVTGLAGSWSASERLPLIYFLVGFPVLVLASFTWLVSKHSGKLFAPADFKNEDNYVKMQLSAVASLAIATTQHKANSDSEFSEENLQERPPEDVQRIVNMVHNAATVRRVSKETWRNQILWVDDRPSNNVHERRAFEALGIEFTLALSTKEALDKMSIQKFAAIISDMGRREGPREGYVLLDSIRRQGDQTPLFFYAGSNSLEHRREAVEHGGQGSTSNAQELFQMVTSAVIAESSR